MYELYAFATPNSIKPAILLEELAQPWNLRAVNIRQGEQRGADFLQLNPNGKVPVLVDSDNGVVLSESAAILVYLAEKHGSLLPANGLTRAKVFEQLFFHASGLSPAFGQAGFFPAWRANLNHWRSSALALKRIGSPACWNVN